MKKIILCLSISTPLVADQIYLHNESDIAVFAAPYYSYTSKNYEQTQAPKAIPAHAITEFERPNFRFDSSGRTLLFSTKIKDLKADISDDQARLLGSQDIALPFNDHFYIDKVKGHLESFNAVNWRFYQPIKNKVISPAMASLAGLTTGRLREAFSDSPYKNKSATIRRGSSLCTQEQKFRSSRLRKIHTALQKFTKTTIDPKKAPVVALCTSGGGVRSALCTTGFLSGLEQIGLLDGVTYLACLSGSTWAVGSWMNDRLSIKAYKNKIVQQAGIGLLNKGLNPADVSSHLFKKFALGRPLTLVDLYGASLGTIFFQGESFDRSSLYLSNQEKSVANATRPLPIYTGMLTKKPYEWVEFTPFEVGSNYLGAYIPSWSFGREFINGKSMHNTPPETLPFMFGIFGYAIGMNFSELIEYGKKKLPEFITSILEKTTKETIIARQRLFPAQVMNYTYGELELARGNQETLTLIDLGVLFNLPLQPLLERPERNVQLIIVLDVSAYHTSGRSKELKKAADYFKERGIQLPPIDYKKAENSICSVFADQQNPRVPTIIYLPLIKNNKFSSTFDPATCFDTFCDTFNFNYTEAQARLLIDLIQTNVIDSKNLIAQAIKEKMMQTGAVKREIKSAGVFTKSMRMRKITA